MLLHYGDLSGARLERRLRSALETVPRHARVTVALSSRPTGNVPSLRKVQVVVVEDGGQRLVEEAVAGEGLVVVVPASAELSPGWLEEVEARTVAQPDHIGVVPLGAHHLFAFPGPVRVLDAPRHGWTAVAGLRKRSSGAPLAHRSLGAVLIVKDEEAVLGACLSAVTPLVDEVVVYDTGSSDATREVAAAWGATVVVGSWDDDFAAARNRALGSCTTDWVLSVDADEVVEASAEHLRRWVDEADGSVALVDIVSTQWDGAREGHRSRSVRLFQRSGLVWRGALHEQVVAAPGSPEVEACTSLPPMTLLHSGYRSAEALAKDKRQRNLDISRIALGRLSQDDPTWGDVCTDYGRSLALAGRFEESVEVLRPLLQHPASPGQLVQASRAVLDFLIGTGRTTEATAWVARARAAGESPGQATVWTAQILARSGDAAAAIAVLEPLTTSEVSGGADVWGRRFEAVTAHHACAEIELDSSDAPAAHARLMTLLSASPETVPLVLVLRVVLTSGHDFEELARRAPAVFIERSVREIFTVCPDVALDWFTACRNVRPDDPTVVVAGSVAAARTGIAEALDWAVHARENGVDVCALRMLAEDAEVPLSARMGAYGLLLHGFLDESVRGALEELDAGADEAARAQATSVLRSVVPDAAELL